MALWILWIPGTINLVISLLVGILNLFIGIGKWFYKILTKNYKYEFLYIAIISGVAIFFEILAINGFQKQQLYTWLGNSPSICMILLDISIGLFIFGLIGYIFMKIGLPTTPYLIGFILGGDLEQYFVDSLKGSGGNLGVFFSRPIGWVIWGLIAISLAYAAYDSRKEKKRMAKA